MPRVPQRYARLAEVDQTISGALARRAARDPGGVFYTVDDVAVTVGQLAGAVDDAARRLVALGLAPGDRVVVWLPNGTLWMTLFLACARTGVVLVTAGPRLRLADLPFMLDHARARALFYVPSFLGADYDAMASELAARRRDGELPTLGHIVRCAAGQGPDGTRAWQEVAPEDGLPPAPAAESLAVVCYTGGTTGRPKGCVHDQRTLVRNARVAARLTGFRPGEVLVSAMPFAHVFGFHMSILQPLVAGAALIEAEPFDAGRVLDLVERHRGTVVYGVPAMGMELVAAQRERPRDLSSLRVALLAGAPVPPKLRRAVREELGCGLTVVYGATESPTLTQLLPDDPAPAALESVGRATPGVELAIVEPGTMRPVPIGQVGEIAARGNNHMVGYLDDPEATAAKHRGEWIIPGDFGRLDADGFLSVTGRAEDMFLCGGFNVYPREVENQLELLAGVAEAVVVGVPDARLGEVGLAFVTAEGRTLSEADVLAWARSNMASYKRPRYVRILSEMPRTHVGKTARGELAARARVELPDLPWGAT